MPGTAPATTGARSTTSAPTTPSTGGTTSEPTIPGPAPSPRAIDVADPLLPGLGDPRIDVHHYDVTLRADPGTDTINGRVVITLAARTTEPLRAFTLDLRGPTVDSAAVDGTPATVDVTGDRSPSRHAPRWTRV